MHCVSLPTLSVWPYFTLLRSRLKAGTHPPRYTTSFLWQDFYRLESNICDDDVTVLSLKQLSSMDWFSDGAVTLDPSDHIFDTTDSVSANTMFRFTCTAHLETFSLVMIWHRESFIYNTLLLFQDLCDNIRDFQYGLRLLDPTVNLDRRILSIHHCSFTCQQC